MNIFPNPAQIETTISSGAFAKHNVDLTVTDVYGRVLNTNAIRLSQTEIKLNISNVPDGKYFVKVDTGSEPLVKALMVLR